MADNTSTRRDTNTEKLQRRNRELSILNTIAEALNREVDLAQALHVVLARVAELFDLKTGWIFLIDAETGKFYPAAVQNLPPALAKSPRRLGGTCYCLDSYEEGDMEGAANVNVITCSRLEGLVDGTDGLRHHASIPLYAHGKPLGVLNVASTDWRSLSPDDLRLLSTVGDLLSMAIERARLFERSVELGVVEERNRLAREIHDTLAQGLTAIALQLETADALLASDAERERANASVQQALQLTRDNLEEARRSVHDLRAAPLEGRTLAQALKVLLDRLTAEHLLDVDFDVTGEDVPLPVRVEVGLYRIAQEALTNVARHAEAHCLQVQLTAMPTHVQLVIADDGRGFDSSHIPQGRYGLIGLNERVKLLGGKMRLNSTPGEGTRLEVTIPLEKT